MEDLIKALQIFLKYSNDRWPTHCEHDEFYVNVPFEKVSKEDIIALEALGFITDDDTGTFISYVFGSC
jgi:hypothetical protein